MAEKVTVTGHNYEYSDDGKSSFYSLIKKKDAENRLRHYLETRHINILPVSIQGEFCAPGIQGNHLKLVKPDWYIFTVNYGERRANFEEVAAVAEALGFPTVPLEETGADLPNKYKDVDALLERARGNYPNGGKKEGIVIRPTVPIFSSILSTWLSMKVINNEYIS